MKNIVGIILFVSTGFAASAQQHLNIKSYKPNYRHETGLAINMDGGFTNKHSVTGGLGLGAMFNHMNHASLNLQIFSNAKALNVPVIGEARFGHIFGTLEVYGGYGYHYSSHTNTHNPKATLNQYVNGWKPGFGVIKHFNQSLFTVGAGLSGNIFALKIGIAAVR